MAYTFDETNDNLSLADNAALTLPNADWAISLWFKLPDATGSGTQFLLSCGLNGDTPTLTLRLNEASAGASPNCLLFTVRDDLGNAATGTSSNTPGTSTAWQHGLIQRSGSNVLLYTDGTLRATGAHTFAATINSANPWVIGSRYDGGAGTWFGGDLAEVAKWDYAMSDLNIARLAAGWRATRFGGLKWYVPMLADTLEKAVPITVTVGDSPTLTTGPTLYDSFKLPTASGTVHFTAA